MPNISTSWTRDSANLFSLWTDDGRFLCIISRGYEQRFAHGFGLVDDTSKPATWTLVRPNKPSRRLGHPGMTVQEAKEMAIARLPETQQG
jgi:hypothetical protein